MQDMDDYVTLPCGGRDARAGCWLLVVGERVAVVT